MPGPSLETVVAANHLFAKYAHAVDRGAVDDVLKLLTDDVVVYPNTNDGHEGIEAAREVFAGIMGSRDKAGRMNQHQVSSVCVEPGSEPAAVAYFNVPVSKRGVSDADALSVFGRYEVQLSSTTMEAKFSMFRIVITHTVSHGPPVPFL